jgi:hypothetical protein
MNFYTKHNGYYQINTVDMDYGKVTVETRCNFSNSRLYVLVPVALDN